MQECCKNSATMPSATKWSIWATDRGLDESARDCVLLIHLATDLHIYDGVIP